MTKLYYYVNIIIDNFEVKKYPKERYILLDYFILDLKQKTINLYDEQIEDSFIHSFGNIKKINVINDKENSFRIIEIDIPKLEKIIIKIESYYGRIKHS